MNIREIAIIQQAKTKEENFVFHRAYDTTENAVEHLFREFGSLELVMISSEARKDDVRKYQSKIDHGREFYLEIVRVY
jgi:hypothetical protein